ncbi:hypothetical protein BVI434_690034 [Burkholderia vietnamiensis]|nr:hypothetical protein BVI434_690034 [Burkholderia vietnamiensis]
MTADAVCFQVVGSIDNALSLDVLQIHIHVTRIWQEPEMRAARCLDRASDRTCEHENRFTRHLACMLGEFALCCP